MLTQKSVYSGMLRDC